MKLLVTGSSGFIGGNLQKHILDHLGYATYGIDIHDFYTEEDWRSKLQSLIRSFNPDVVFHVGACSDTLNSDVNYMFDLNFESTKILCDWCVENRKPLIYSSSAACYGSDGYAPSNLYGWSKYAAECYVISKGGIALRYFNVYGQGESHKGRMSSFFFQSFQKNKNGDIIRIFPGNPKRDFVYIDDVLSANIFALNNFEDLKSDWYDVGSGESRSFEDILKFLEIIEFNYTGISEIPQGYQFYTESSKFMNGWKPKYNLELGIKDYIGKLKNE